MMVQNWQFDKRTELLISVVGEEEKLNISENVSKSLKHGLQEVIFINIFVSENAFCIYNLKNS